MMEAELRDKYDLERDALVVSLRALLEAERAAGAAEVRAKPSPNSDHPIAACIPRGGAHSRRCRGQSSA